MLPVPPSDAQASSILTLAVIVASRVAKLCIAQFSFPTVFTLALVIDASAVQTTVEVAKFK